MHKLDEGYAPRFNKKQMDIMFQTYTDNTYKCKCGHSVVISKKVGKIICNWCGEYVYRDKREEFKEKLKEVI